MEILREARYKRRMHLFNSRFSFVSFFCALCLSFNIVANIPSRVSNWEVTGNKDGVESFRREIPGSAIIDLKGIGTIDQPLWKVAASLLDTARAHEWVDSLEKSSVARIIDRNTYIEYNHVRTPFFMKDRDFVSLVKISVDRNKKTFSLSYEPTEEEGLGKKNHILGEINPGFFQLTALDKEHTLLSGEVHCDPKGAIPKWLVNFFQSDWAHDTIVALRSQAAKSDVRIPEEFADVLQPTLSF